MEKILKNPLTMPSLFGLFSVALITGVYNGYSYSYDPIWKLILLTLLAVFVTALFFMSILLIILKPEALGIKSPPKFLGIIFPCFWLASLWYFCFQYDFDFLSSMTTIYYVKDQSNSAKLRSNITNPKVGDKIEVEISLWCPRSCRITQVDYFVDGNKRENIYNKKGYGITESEKSFSDNDRITESILVSKIFNRENAFLRITIEEAVKDKKFFRSASYTRDLPLKNLFNYK